MIKLINMLINGLGVALQAVLLLLPDSPFNFAHNIDSGFLGFLNFVFPVQSAVAHLVSFVTAAALYYGIRIVLRWIKASSS